MDAKKEWFSDWFNSPYYHILYQDRDESEAQFFLTNLVAHLGLKNETSIIDLACGKGRHSIFLNSLGFDVTGVDLSDESIQSAKAFSNEKLHFFVNDLRHLNLPGQYDLALNLFTSFGYFQSMEENNIVMQHVSNCLKSGGKLVIDFMNTAWVIQNLIEQQSKTIDDIQFKISKWIENGFICKKIHFVDELREFEFTEKVQALTISDFTLLLQTNGFTLLETFGDYYLNPFKMASSPRLIMIAQKNA